jgi:hypothetical protein
VYTIVCPHNPFDGPVMLAGLDGRPDVTPKHFVGNVVLQIVVAVTQTLPLPLKPLNTETLAELVDELTERLGHAVQLYELMFTDDGTVYKYELPLHTTEGPEGV